MNWVKDNRYTNIFTCTEIFDKYKYVVTIATEESSKAIKFWVGVSSGKKRKELEIFGNKENKSLGGIRALLWVKKAILYFPKYFNELYKTEDVKLYICIEWSDNRRRNIYERLKKDGFYFMHINGSKVLIKEITEL